MDQEARILTPKEEKQLAKLGLTADESYLVRKAWERENPPKVTAKKAVFDFFIAWAIQIFILGQLVANLFYENIWMSRFTVLAVVIVWILMFVSTPIEILMTLVLAPSFDNKLTKLGHVMMNTLRMHSIWRLFFALTLDFSLFVLLVLNGHVFSGVVWLFCFLFSHLLRKIRRSYVRECLNEEVTAWKRAQASSTAGS